MLPFKTLIEIDRNAGTPVYLQICNGFIQMITNGILHPENALPSSRKLAELLKINRNTVQFAYEELSSQGWAISIYRRGYFVKAKPSDKQPNQVINPLIQQKNKQTFQWTKRFAAYPAVHNLHNSPLAIDEGSPDVRLAPISELLRECRSIHNHRYGKNFLKYSNPKGSERLRTSISKHLSRTRGFKPDIEDIIITKGSQMSIYITSQLLVDVGDTIAVGNSNYHAADMAFTTAGAKLLRIPIDENGMDIDYLEKVLLHHKIKAVFVIPQHHCPTTVTMSLERRKKLVKLAKIYRFAIIEDDYDFDFHYDESPYLPLASINDSENVIYIGSISKSFAPAIRIGFMIGPKDFINDAASLRKVIEQQGDTLLEEAFASMFELGEMERHFRKSTKVYKERRDIFCELLSENFHNYLAFNKPQGGLAVWTEFNNDINIKKMTENALKKGLYVADGQFYRNEYFNSNSLRMGFASLDSMEVEKAVGILKLSIA